MINQEIYLYMEFGLLVQHNLSTKYYKPKLRRKNKSTKKMARYIRYPIIMMIEKRECNQVKKSTKSTSLLAKYFSRGKSTDLFDFFPIIYSNLYFLVLALIAVHCGIFIIIYFIQYYHIPLCDNQYMLYCNKQKKVLEKINVTQYQK